MPDTAYICPLLCTGVVCDNPVLIRNETSYKGSFHFYFHSSCLTPQNHCHPQPVFLCEKENLGGIFMHRIWRQMTGQVSQSGKPPCTGSSLWAVPKLARGTPSFWQAEPDIRWMPNAPLGTPIMSISRILF